MAARVVEKVRLMDWQFELEKTEPLSPLLDLYEPADFDWMEASELALDPIRPWAIDVELPLVLLLENSVLGLSSVPGYERLVESEVFRALLRAQCRKRPARSTVARYLSLAFLEGRQRFHEAVCRKAKAEGLDDFAEVTVESTAVEANSAWPTDSGLILGFPHQSYGLLQRHAELTGVGCTSSLVERWLAELERQRQHKAISLLPWRPCRATERQRLYRKLLRTARLAHGKLCWMRGRKRDPIGDCRIAPGLRQRVDAIVAEVARRMEGAAKVMAAARLLVLEGGKVAAADRAFSLADPDAWMIEKEGRDPVLCYKPQLSRSANGFITAFEILQGNPPDSTRLVELTSGHIRNTGATPCLVAAADGYSAQGNLDALVDLGARDGQLQRRQRPRTAGRLAVGRHRGDPQRPLGGGVDHLHAQAHVRPASLLPPLHQGRRLVSLGSGPDLQPLASSPVPPPEARGTGGRRLSRRRKVRQAVTTEPAEPEKTLVRRCWITARTCWGW